MIMIVGGREQGKTHKAINLANSKDAYLSVHSRKRASEVYHGEDYPNLKYFPITYDELLNRSAGKNIKVFIDDIGNFVEYCVDVPVVGFTGTPNTIYQLSDINTPACPRCGHTLERLGTTYEYLTWKCRGCLEQYIIDQI